MKKKVTRYCCPYCGKDNWNERICPEHVGHWVLWEATAYLEWREANEKLCKELAETTVKFL